MNLLDDIGNIRINEYHLIIIEIQNRINVKACGYPNQA